MMKEGAEIVNAVRSAQAIGQTRGLEQEQVRGEEEGGEGGCCHEPEQREKQREPERKREPEHEQDRKDQEKKCWPDKASMDYSAVSRMLYYTLTEWKMLGVHTG